MFPAGYMGAAYCFPFQKPALFFLSFYFVFRAPANGSNNMSCQSASHQQVFVQQQQRKKKKRTIRMPIGCGSWVAARARHQHSPHPYTHFPVCLSVCLSIDLTSQVIMYSVMYYREAERCAAGNCKEMIKNVRIRLLSSNWTFLPIELKKRRRKFRLCVTAASANTERGLLSMRAL